MKHRTAETADIRGLVRRNGWIGAYRPHPHRVMHQDTVALHRELVHN
jgi:hypothetical protein